MPRANRCFLPGHVWHITQRCHQREFLLRFAADRERWLHWLSQARRRFGLCVLNYIVTSNHIHLLVQDQGKGEIAASMQLIAGRTAQEYNARKGRRGAYWEDRYHATAIDSAGYLARCITYIDMNMVRAGVVKHPRWWTASGYREIQSSSSRSWIINRSALVKLLGLSDFATLQQQHKQWTEAALRSEHNERDECWTQALAVGGHSFVSQFQTQLGMHARYQEISEVGDTFRLGEKPLPYNSNYRPKTGFEA